MNDLPSPILDLLWSIHARYANTTDGEIATYIPELARADPMSFGICLVMADGTVYEVGDTRTPLTIQSISKPFTYALALEEFGPEAVGARIGVEPTGEAFNAITLDADTGAPLNAMVNAGAIVAAGMIVEASGSGATELLLDRYAAFAGHDPDDRLEIDDRVLQSEAETGHRNRAIAHLVRGSGALRSDPEPALDLYFRQCSVSVDCRDLGVMAATLAAGGKDPLHGRQVVSRSVARHVLTVMSTCGMYDAAGRWALAVGLPAKSGVSGGIVAVLPGQLGIAVTSPPLDRYGNSERGMRVCEDLARELDLQLVRTDRHLTDPVRSSFTLAEVGSGRRRRSDDVIQLERLGDQVRVVALQGDLDFGDVERVVRRLISTDARFIVVDLRHADAVHQSFASLIAPIADHLGTVDGALVVCGIDRTAPVVEQIEARLDAGALHHADTLDLALEWCEDRLLADEGSLASEHDEHQRLTLGEHDALAQVETTSLATLEAFLEERHHRAGDVVLARDSPPTEILFIMSGRLRIVVNNGDASEHRVATLSAGSIVGELALAAGRPRRTDVIAETVVDCLALTSAAMRTLRTDEPTLWIALVEGVVRLLADRADQIRVDLWPTSR